MKVIHLARKPLSEPNLAANVLKWGTGALNIDGCRIATDNALHGSTRRDDIRGGNYGCGSTPNPGDIPDYHQHAQGRWPANVILEHLPDCRRVGIRQVKAITGGPTSGDNAFGQDSGWNAHQNRPTEIQRPGEDGLETVDAWECEPGCPADDLDYQTGTIRSGSGTVKRATGADQEGNTGSAYGAESRPAGTPQIWYGDEGGPSRFFKQVKR